MFITTHYKKVTALLLSITCSLAVSANCYATETKDENIHIQADKMHFDLQSDTSIYNGNVRLTQGTMELSGDYIEIKQENNQIIRMIAKGSPAKYHQIGEDGSNILAQSKLMEYFATEDRLILIDQARLTQDDQIIESERIVYDTEKQTLLAGQNSVKPDENKRVKITLTPSDKK